MKTHADRTALIVLAALAAAAMPETGRADTPQPTSRPTLLDSLAAMVDRSRTQDALIDQLLDEPPAPADNSLAGAVQVNDRGLIELHVRDAEISVVLEMLSCQLRTNIVTSTRVKGAVSANLYGVTLDQALEAILIPNQFAFERRGNSLFVATPEELAERQPDPEAHVFRLAYLTRAEAVAALTPLLSSKGVIGAAPQKTQEAGETGGGARGAFGDISTETSGNYLVVTDAPDRLRQIGRLLAELDVRPRQVLIEATILRATLNEENQLGVDFTLLGGVDFQNVDSASLAGANLVTGELPPTQFQDTTLNFNTNLLANAAEGGFRFGVIKNNVAAFVQALEDVTDVTVVANPKVIALNKQDAEVIVGRRDGYLTTTVTETAAVQTVEFLETGTQIRFRPLVNPDNSVRMEVHPKDSNGGLTQANLPFEETTEARASILVNDGHTVLIGGLFRERSVASRSQIPLLGQIPAAGLLFQSRRDQTVREEVIILLTVHVLKESDSETSANEALLDDIERVRVGSRRGLLGLGRERLAQAFYQEAVRQAEQQNWDAALLNARMALHNNPRHLGAIKLKEELQARRMWEDPGTRMNSFALELIRNEALSTNPPLPLFGRPEPADRLRTANPPDPTESGDARAP